MNRAIAYNFSDNFIEELSGFLLNDIAKGKNDFSRVACVFGGRRPALFLNRKLSRHIKKSFIPPRIFSIDEFVDFLIARKNFGTAPGDLDSAFCIYNLAKKKIPGLLAGQESFAQFLPWAKEIVSFIEQLDLEDIANEALKNIEKSAQIGYEIPENINRLLEHIVVLRKAYHQELTLRNRYSRGLRYARASLEAQEAALEEFDAILFCNFFYLHRTEQKIIKAILAKEKGACVFQGSQDAWSVLAKDAKELNCVIRPAQPIPEKFDLSLYQGFDIHSQCCIVRSIIAEKIKEHDETVIVVPRPETIIPLLTEISPQVKDLNVSMGYSLKRTSLYALFNALYKAQETKKEARYYTKDYLSLLKHPLVKNLKIAHDTSITRVLVHKLEELLQGQEKTSVGGSLFLSLPEIEGEEAISRLTVQTLENMDISTNTDECKKVLHTLHTLLFTTWEEVRNFSEFSSSLKNLLSVLIEQSDLITFPFNLKVIERLQAIQEELMGASFSKEVFERSEMWEIFQQKLESEMVSFIGSPLKGMQILGLFETRSLNFKNVIVMDANESILPKLKIYEPLIPREVMLNLGLNRLEKEEEIQRYQFMRLIGSAKNVHLIYEENQEKEKSRFIEELLWKKQKQDQKLEIGAIPKASFAVKIAASEARIKKTAAMVESLKKSRYSASRINTYLRCPLQFYYKYVLGLEEREDLLDEPDASHIGTFLHELLEDTFKIFRGKRPEISEKFEKFFFEEMKKKFKQDLSRRMKSDSFLLERIMRDRLKKFLEAESARKVEKLICVEEDREDTLVLCGNPVPFRYTIDRIDELRDGSIVIIDYKSGSIADAAPGRVNALSSMEQTRAAIKKTLKSFQLPIYYYFIAKEFPGKNVNAELYSLRTVERKSFITQSELAQREQIMDICLQSLECIFAEIIDPDIPFVPDKEVRKCEYCEFGALCR
ncbi:MAG: PD-(D/E)XK nuclease family protein [Candidatus Omnitrophica bacterium]|nr:PD-(D/E)XK nuclease family protein [Candidatus Omnitrophota bacterium]